MHARIRVRLFEMFQRVGREEAKVAVEEFRRVAKTGDSRADGEERKSGETLENDQERGESESNGGKTNGVHASAAANVIFKVIPNTRSVGRFLNSLFVLFSSFKSMFVDIYICVSVLKPF